MTPPLADRLAAMVAKYPATNRHALARIALAFGLEEMELNERWMERDPGAKRPAT